MKVTIYTINDCKFSQAEKEYLKNNNIAFEEKNLETNRDYLTEMLKISDNFAGTPVTRVEKDGGEIIILKGFTQDEFAKALNLELVSPQPASTPTPPMAQAPSQTSPTTQVSTIPVQTVADVSANKPDMTIESLSEPAVSTQSVTSASPPEPVMPPMPSEPAAPMSIPAPVEMNSALTPNEVPVNPLENQEVGPISLDSNDQTPAPMGEPAAPVAMSTPNSQTTQAGAQTSGLDSVLQNLQTQVQAGVPPTNTPPKS